LKEYNIEWDQKKKAKKSKVPKEPYELLPTLETESPNINPNETFKKQGKDYPVWGMSYEIAKETLEYIDRLKTKVYVVCIEDSKFKSFIRFDPQGPNEIYKDSLKDIDYSLRWDNKELAKVKKTPWKFMACILKDISQETPEEITNVYSKILSQLFTKHPDMPIRNGMYIFSLRDLILYRKDGTEPWVDVVGYNQKLQYIPKTMLPIFNSTGEKNCWDIPIPTYEDWNYVNDPEYKTKFTDIVLDWNKKKPTAIFRGGAAGCGYNAKTNARIGLAKLSQRLRLQGKADILDAGIIAGKNKKFKFYRDTGLGYFSMEELRLKTADFKTKKEQSEYKYIVYAEGNVAAHRLASDMLLGSVILFVESEYTLWFEHLLKPYQHYIPIKRDLSNFEEMVLWCRANDDICKKIGENNRAFALDILTKDIVLNVIGNALIKISL